MAGRKSGHASYVQRGVGGAGPTITRVIVLITCVAAIHAVAQGFEEPPPAPVPAIDPTAVPAAPAVDPDDRVAGELPEVEEPEGTEPRQGPARVGIIAGHWGYDSGAACPDGLEEVQVNLDVAQRVVQSLRALGHTVDLLEEFDPRLTGYSGDAVVSIHADSCQPFPEATPPPTGFKVASLVDSAVPEEERLLVSCLYREYGARTGLPTHDTSITGHMTYYHAFYQIDEGTPAAIIEMGFLWLDRELLTGRADLVAQGIVDGILCFLGGH